MIIPPPLPETPYTSCYCEENIYLLAEAFYDDAEITVNWDIFIVFISNPSKTVALWCQKRARGPDWPVLWDYHVILMLRPRQDVNVSTSSDVEHPISWIYDFDAELKLPYPARDYLDDTFRPTPPQYQSLFRIIPCGVFLQEFASDRSHMLVVKNSHAVISLDEPATGSSKVAYISPPPSYQPICGIGAAEKGVSNNFMSVFVEMSSSAQTIGRVLDKQTIAQWV